MAHLQLKKKFEYKDLPDMASILADATRIASEITIGETVFMKEHGVRSEAEYKRRMADQGQVMKHTHIGWNSWDSTARGMEKIYAELTSRGSHIDRFGYSLDWVMGVPVEKRHLLPVGTGLTFSSPEEWARAGQIVPVQPHFGDHMIASCNSVENARFALNAGVTTIGNISHYYTYEYPGVDMEQERVIDMLKAIAVMGRFRDQGTIIHSNLDDGFGAQYHDLANLTGWAIMERYLVEDLLGGGMGHCFGNLFSDPMLRIIFNQAMWEINRTKTPGSMIYGNTIDFGFDYNRNFGALASFTLADCMGQVDTPTGHAVTVIPVTEAVRVPSADEIIEAHMTVDMMFEKAQFYQPFLSWEKVRAEKNILVACGRIFFERVLNGLDDLGIDITHAGEVFAALKDIGAEQLERYFGIGESDKAAMRGRKPVRPTNIVATIMKKQDDVAAKVTVPVLEGSLDGYRVIVGSTDVHQFGKEIVKSILTKAGATVFDLGSNVPTSEIFDTMVETQSRHIVISTFNGIALSYAEELVSGLHQRGLDALVIMGGLLNENRDGSDLAVDVTDDLRQLGVQCDNVAEKLVEVILAS